MGWYRARKFGVMPRKTVEAGEVFFYDGRINWADPIPDPNESNPVPEAPAAEPADDAPKRRGRPPKSAG